MHKLFVGFAYWSLCTAVLSLAMPFERYVSDGGAVRGYALEVNANSHGVGILMLILVVLQALRARVKTTSPRAARFDSALCAVAAALVLGLAPLAFRGLVSDLGYGLGFVLLYCSLALATFCLLGGAITRSELSRRTSAVMPIAGLLLALLLGVLTANSFTATASGFDDRSGQYANCDEVARRADYNAIDNSSTVSGTCSRNSARLIVAGVFFGGTALTLVFLSIYAATSRPLSGRGEE